MGPLLVPFSKVAGLSQIKAKKIIDYRTENGPFLNRKQLLDVPSIGKKTFEQCAGFLTIRSASEYSNAHYFIRKTVFKLHLKHLVTASRQCLTFLLRRKQLVLY